ncbi:hypothetical protein [Gemmatimonas sp.]|uniref:hypothetical protein n=1 Tax=Gemmatimonas sp. TaxID=1962908 RepID=UPI00286D2917|nr:hypothetical protein [Gemmatimonas sp.]
MPQSRTFVCASFLLAASLPSLLRAQATLPEVPRPVVGNALTLVVPSPVRRYSLGMAPRAFGSLRWRLQDSSRTDQPVPIVLRLDSISQSAPECPMPVARMAPESVPRMPVAQVDSSGAPPRLVAWRGCTNPLGELGRPIR